MGADYSPAGPPQSAAGLVGGGANPGPTPSATQPIIVSRDP